MIQKNHNNILLNVIPNLKNMYGEQCVCTTVGTGFDDKIWT